MSETVKETLESLRKEEEDRCLRQRLTGLRNILVHARCRHCDDYIGDQDFDLEEIDGQQEIIHASCGKDNS